MRTLTLPRKFRTRVEWLDLAAAVDSNLLPSAELLADLGDDAGRIMQQAARVVEWANAVLDFRTALARYAQRHALIEGTPGGCG